MMNASRVNWRASSHAPWIVLPAGFEYEVADIGSASSKSQGPVQVDFRDSYGQFAHLHLGSHGVVRAQ